MFIWRRWEPVVLGLLLILLVSCGLAGGAGDASETEVTEALRFVVRVGQATDQQIDLEIGFANDGRAAIPADDAVEYAWELRAADEELRASGLLHTRPELPPGEQVFPLRWSGELEPGVYRIVWGGLGQGHTTVSFEVIAQANGLHVEVMSAADSPDDPPFVD